MHCRPLRGRSAPGRPATFRRPLRPDCIRARPPSASSATVSILANLLRPAHQTMSPPGGDAGASPPVPYAPVASLLSATPLRTSSATISPFRRSSLPFSAGTPGRSSSALASLKRLDRCSSLAGSHHRSSVRRAPSRGRELRTDLSSTQDHNDGRLEFLPPLHGG
jgi:hypothetical protein